MKTLLGNANKYNLADNEPVLRIVTDVGGAKRFDIKCLAGLYDARKDAEVEGPMVATKKPVIKVSLAGIVKGHLIAEDQLAPIVREDGRKLCVTDPLDADTEAEIPDGTGFDSRLFTLTLPEIYAADESDLHIISLCGQRAIDRTLAFLAEYPSPRTHMIASVARIALDHAYGGAEAA